MDRSERPSLHRLATSRGHLVVEVYGGDPPTWEGFAMAQRADDGSVAFAIYARETREAGFPATSGGLAFDLLYQAVREKGAVPAIGGEWHPSSDNFKEFKTWREQGRTPAEAALDTFTGRSAARHGYTRVVVMEEGDSVVRVRFEPGAGP